MPNWKKVVTSGSNAHLNQITASGNISSSGTLIANAITLPNNSISGDLVSGGTIGTTTITALAGNLSLGDNNITNVGSIDVDQINDDATNGDTTIAFTGTTLDIDVGTVDALDFTATKANFTLPIVTNSHITASGNISASGKLFAYGADFADQNITNVQNINVDSVISDANSGTEIQFNSANLSFGVNAAEPFKLEEQKVSVTSDAGLGLFVETNITASGNISASGTIFTENIQGNTPAIHQGVSPASRTAGLTIANDLDVRSHITASGNISGSSTSTLSIGGNLSLGNDIKLLGNGINIEDVDGNERISFDTGETIFNTGNNNHDFKVKSEGITAICVDAQEDAVVIGGETVPSGMEFTVNGDISGSGKLYAGKTNAQVVIGDGHITASGNISGSSTSTIQVGGNITTNGDLSTTNVVVSDGGGVGATNDKFIFDETNDRIYNYNVNTKIIGNGTGTSDMNTYDDFMQGGSIASMCNNLNGTEPMFLAVNTRDATNAHVFNQFRTAKDDRVYNIGIHASSGDFFISSGSVSRTQFIIQDTTNNIGIGTQTPNQKLTVEGNISASSDLFIGKADSSFVSASNGNIQSSGSGRGQLDVDYRLFDTGSTHLTSAGGGIGDVVKFGASSTVAGDIYYLQPEGTWQQAKADVVGTSTSSLAVALGSNSTTSGMLLKGMVKLDSDPVASIGHPVYLDSGSAGHATKNVPNSGVARVIGHYYSGSGLIYFNPDNTFVEIA